MTCSRCRCQARLCISRVCDAAIHRLLPRSRQWAAPLSCSAYLGRKGALT
jgi:hypothetical protein